MQRKQKYRPRSPKAILKEAIKRTRRRFIHMFFPFGPGELASALSQVGLTAGDAVLVHVSYGRFEGFRGTPLDVIRVLQQAVGATGTIMMPTIPFSGRAVDHASRGEVMDLSYTPSAMGLVTEIFRRMPGVVRSVHPTHSVAVWGAHAGQLVRDHHLATTPCGHGTPFLRLLDVSGKVLFLGSSVRAMTFYHGLEEMLEAELPVAPFTEEVFELQTRDLEGRVWTTRTRLFSKARRDSTLLVPVLKRMNAWREGRVGRLPIAAVGCRDILAATRELGKAGRSIYPAA